MRRDYNRTGRPGETIPTTPPLRFPPPTGAPGSPAPNTPMNLLDTEYRVRGAGYRGEVHRAPGPWTKDDASVRRPNTPPTSPAEEYAPEIERHQLRTASFKNAEQEECQRRIHSEFGRGHVKPFGAARRIVGIANPNRTAAV